MRIAVVGAGLAGLGSAYFLLQQGYQVTLFDRGDGASRLPVGLCHPYVGKVGKRSVFATEAMALTNELIDFAEKVSHKKLADRSGIVRKDWEPPEWYDDLEKVEGGILIRSGMTVFLKEYVTALADALDVTLVQGKFSCEDAFDRIVFACGADIKNLGFLLPLGFVKGQVLIGTSQIECNRSVMKASGHLSPFGEGLLQLGSTYEHNFVSDEPDLEVACRELATKRKAFFTNPEDFCVRECRSGVRVSVQSSYTPIVQQLSEKIFVFTGLGSRGLLYHAYYGRHLANLLV